MVDVVEDEVEEGEVVSCPECGVELEVVNTNPLELDLLEEDYEEDEEGDTFSTDDDDDDDDEEE